MELRDIEIFLTLAEELHFGRTAERLHISQARVSQSIAKQERRIGAALFERTSRRVALTAIGTQLYEDLKAGYGRIMEGTETAIAAARGTSGNLTLGTFGPHVHELAPVLGLFRSRHPGCELGFREVHFSDPFGPLRNGEVDLQTCWLPVREPDLTVGPVVMAEPLILMVSSSHPYAQRESVTMEDLGECTVPQVSQPIPAYWEEGVLPFHTPGGRPIRRGPKVATFQEVMAVVAANRAVSVVHGEAVRYYPRPGLCFVPIEDAPIGEWALIWRTAGETPLVRAFAQAARDADPAI